MGGAPQRYKKADAGQWNVPVEILDGAKRGATGTLVAALLLIVFMPACLLVQWIDYRRRHASGAGLLIVARPQANPQSP